MTTLPDCELARQLDQDMAREFGEVLAQLPKPVSPDATPLLEWRAKPGKEL